MAHNIGQMFYVGERPWHGLGKWCPEPLALDAAITEAGLDYTVRTMPLAVDGEPKSAAPQRVAVVRDDAGITVWGGDLPAALAGIAAP